MANDFSGDPNCVSLWNLESADLTADGIGTNTLSNNGADPDATYYKQGSGSAHFISANTDWMSRADASLSSNFPFKSGTTNRTVSVCCWVRFDSVASVHYVWSKLATTSPRSIAMAVNAGTIYFRIGYGAGNVSDDITFGTSVVADRWYHISCTYDDSDGSYRIRIWDDTAGALLGTDVTGTTGHTPAYVGNATWLLGVTHNSAWWLGGYIDELVVFNDVLTADEIDQIRAGTYGNGGGASDNAIMLGAVQ